MRVHHIAIQVSELERARAFYVDVLGLVETRRQPHSIWLDAAGTIVMLELPPSGTPAATVAFEIPADARERWRAKLTAAGAPIDGETAFTLYTRDPDGSRIGLSSYPNRSGDLG